MAIAEKLQNIINEKQSQITITNYGLPTGKKINASTKFIDYPKYIFKAFIESLNNPDTLFNNLPKITGTGTNITLNNTIEAPMKIELGASELEQETTTGKNLLLTTKSNVTNGTYVSGANTNQYKIQATGTDLYVNNVSSAGGNYSINNGNKISCNYGETIYYDTGNILFNRIYVTEWDSSDVSLGYYYKQANSSTGTHTPTNSNCSYITLRFGNSSATSGTTYTLAPMVSKSSITDYEPYTEGIPAPNPTFPMDIHTISGSNAIKVEGKNLFDGTLVNKTFITTDGSMVSAGNRVAIENYITLSNGTYTINSNKEVVVYVYDTSNNFVSGESFISWNSVPFTFNITGTKKIRVGFRNSDNSNISPTDVTNIQLEKGTATPYTPYTSQEANIDLKSKNLAITGWADRFVEAINSRSNVYLINRDNRYCLRYNPSAGYGSYDTKNLTLGVTFKPNTQYTVSYDILKESSTSKTVAFHYTDGTWETPSSEESATDIWVHQTITSSASKTVDYIAPYYTSGNTYIDINTFMINEGTTELDYVPYYDYGFCGKIGNYEDKFIRTSGKNSFDKDNTTILNAYVSASGVWTSSNAGEKSFIMKVQPNTTYTISKLTTKRLRIIENSTSDFTYNSTYNLILGTVTDNTGGTFTTGASGNYIAVFFLNNVNETYTLQQVLNSMMINEGSTALPYEPYGTDEWYIKKNIGKVVLDESLYMNYNGTAGQFYAANQTKLPDYLAGTPILCNYFKYSSTTWTLNALGITSSKTFWLYIENGPTNYSDLQTWLSTHNLDIRYVLATPTYTPITGTLAEQLEATKYSKDGVTNISQINNDLPFGLSVSALENLNV